MWPTWGSVRSGRSRPRLRDRGGDGDRGVTATGAELSARFAAKVVHTLGCHFWVGGIADVGYGRFAVGGGRVVPARWWAWEQAYGPVPDGLMVMHACDETSCVNAVECLLLGDQAGTWSRWPIARIDAGPRPGPA